MRGRRKSVEEQGIIEQAKQHDEQAFAEIVTMYKPYIERLAFQFGIRPDSIPDVVQETFLNIHRSLHQFERGKFSTWLYQITLNVVRDHYRRKKRQWKIFNKVTEDKKLWLPGYVYFEEEEHDVLHEAVKQLDEKYRIPIILFYFHDQSYEEIAIILKIKLSSVKTRMHRGRGKLKEAYLKLERRGAARDGRQTIG